ncbi:glycosyl hydrolase [Sphingomonas deserti]|uniref:Glycosyl hydrolase n=2 Tax=Allosphingosinicella deserti TaxID=2116704 RepID=A0A2P7QMF7_9SPHN|nr:glycosyl hydrolase [Sphingomonas deserti]
MCWKRIARVARRSIAGALLVGAASAAAAAPRGASEVESWLTTPDGTARLSERPRIVLQPGSPAGAIRVDRTRRYQEMVGFGAAISDASAYLIQNKLAPAKRDALLRDLFGRDGGVGFSFTRLTIGGSDFSRTHQSYDDRPAGESDPALRHFSVRIAEQEVLPVARAARAINTSLKIMATPWSPPGWMKTSGSMIKGTLRDEYRAAFATYLRRTVQDFGARGVPIDYLSIQNEPDFEPDDYPGMRLSAAQRAAIIGHYVGPEFARAGLATRILEWDHNWDKPEQPLAVLADPEAARFVSGVAWHCYGGDVSAQSKVRDLHPDKDVFFTECSGGEWSPGWTEAWPWMMRNLIIGTTRNWARGVLLWNLALDENFGPHLGGCGNCRGVVTIDSKTGAVTRNPEYYALGHLSRFVPRGARRIESTSPDPDLLTVAFEDEGALVLLAFNAGKKALAFAVASDGRHFRTRLAPNAAATFRWPAAR